MNKQTGSALIISLLMLLVMTLLGITSIGASTLEEKMAANSRDQKTAFQATEDILITAEDTVINADWQDEINRGIIAVENTSYYTLESAVAYYNNNTWGAADCMAIGTGCYIVQLAGEETPLALGSGYGQISQANRRQLKLNITARGANQADSNSIALLQSTINKIDIPTI